MDLTNFIINVNNRILVDTKIGAVRARLVSNLLHWCNEYRALDTNVQKIYSETLVSYVILIRLILDNKIEPNAIVIANDLSLQYQLRKLNEVIDSTINVYKKREKQQSLGRILEIVHGPLMHNQIPELIANITTITEDSIWAQNVIISYLDFAHLRTESIYKEYGLIIERDVQLYEEQPHLIIANIPPPPPGMAPPPPAIAKPLVIQRSTRSQPASSIPSGAFKVSLSDITSALKGLKKVSTASQSTQ